MTPIGDEWDIVQGQPVNHVALVCCPYYYIGASSLGSTSTANYNVDVSGKSLNDLLEIRRSIVSGA